MDFKQIKAEKRRLDTKTDENIQLTELKNQLIILKDENRDLKNHIRESKTEASLLRGEISGLKSLCNESNLILNHKRDSIDLSHEIHILRNQINALK